MRWLTALAAIAAVLVIAAMAKNAQPSGKSATPVIKVWAYPTEEFRGFAHHCIDSCSITYSDGSSPTSVQLVSESGKALAECQCDPAR